MRKKKLSKANNLIPRKALSDRILGVRIDLPTKNRVLREVRSFVERKHKFYITTPNPEIVLLASKDNKLKKIIANSSICLPDGSGVVMAVRFDKLYSPKDPLLRFLYLFFKGLGIGTKFIFHSESGFEQVVRGREVFMDLIRLANKKGWRVFLLGGEGNEATGTRSEIEKNYKRIKIEATKGPMLDQNGSPTNKNEKIVENISVQKINKFKPHILFVAFGAPKQEKWVYKWLPKLNIGGAMVVGGTFKYISGLAKLPPKNFTSSGLEWIWRFFTGSQKLDRIFTAFPIFPLKVFWNKYNFRS